MELLKNHLSIRLILKIKHKYLQVRNLTRQFWKYKVDNHMFRLIVMFINKINLVKIKIKEFKLIMKKTTIMRIKYKFPMNQTAKNFKNQCNNKTKKMKLKIKLKIIYYKLKENNFWWIKKMPLNPILWKNNNMIMKKNNLLRVN
jgi:hypothetical protein